MNILSITTGLTLFLALHTLNATYIYFKRKKEILFFIIEILIIALTIFCLGIPYHYFQSLDSKLLAVYPVFLIMINLANATFVFFRKSRLQLPKHDENGFVMYLAIPLLFFFMSTLFAHGLESDFTQTVATQPTTVVLYKTELDSDVTLSYYRNNPFAHQKDMYPTTFTTLQELKDFEKHYKDSNPTVVVTAQGATSETKSKLEFQLKLNPVSDEALALQLATPEQIQISITQIRLTKLERTQIQWFDVLFQTNYKVQGDPITVLEIDYEITNLEQLQNAKEVQHKLDKLLQNVQ